MGYSTDFTGRLTITPPLDEEKTETINLFCGERHGGNIYPFDGLPGLWCDWETDGEKLFWNGSEKSYQMKEWLEYLITTFFRPWGCTVTGKLLAQGENHDDRWILEVMDNEVIRIKIDLCNMLGITE